MNKKTIFGGITAMALLLSSCQSMNQFYGVTTGASIGGMFGSAIGGIADGPRGSDLGTVVGMAVLLLLWMIYNENRDDHDQRITTKE